MKTKILLFSAALLLAACNSSSDEGWKTHDLRYVPLIKEHFETGSYIAYLDIQTGKEVNNVEAGTLFYDGYAVVSSDDGYFFMGHDMKCVPEKGYSDATVYHDGIAWVVKKGGPLTAIDKKGKMLFELKQAETAVAFHEGLAVFSNAEGEWGIVDKKGRVVADPQWSDMSPMFVNGLIAVKARHNNLWGLINRKGEVVVDCEYKEIGTGSTEQYFLQNYVQALSQGRILVKDENGKWGVIDHKGNIVINPQFEEIFLDGENYLFRKGRLYGWCDKEGRYLINPQFEEAMPFDGCELAAVEDGNKDRWGYIDKAGKWVIAPQFREASPFLACGIAPVKDAVSREWGAVDKTGKYVINPQFRVVYDYGAGDKLLVVNQSRNVGIVGADGKYVVSPDYDDGTKELLCNVSGIGAKYKAQSDYVDFEMLAGLIDAEIHTLKRTTTGALKTAYNLNDSRFPKNGGEVMLCKKKATREMTFKLAVPSVDAWNKTSDGWFGFNYSFNPDVSVDSYIITVEFDGKGKAWRFVDEIFDVLKHKYPYDEEHGTLSISGYSLVFAAPITNGGIIISVKPE